MTAVEIQREGTLISIEALEKYQMRPQEFRLIGRFVSLTYKEEKYVGLVTHFTKDTMVMCNALRMTKDYFDGPFRLGASGKGGVSFALPRSRPAGTESTPEGTTAAFGHIESSPTDPRPRSISPSRVDPFTHEFPRGPHPEESPPKLMPLVTLSRLNVQAVQYATDHGQTHRSLATASINAMPHQQLLRTYVRRYLVHTIAKNNPHRILLLDFVRTRTKSQLPTAQQVQALAEEELVALLKLEEEVTQRRERAAAQRALNASTNAQGGSRGNRSNGRDLLFAVQVPARTSYVAIAHLALAITIVLYAASSFSSADRALVFGFIGKMLGWLVAAAVSLLATGAVTGFNGLNMSFPVTRKAPFILRVVCLVVASAMILSAAIGTSLAVFQQRSPMTGDTLREYYNAQVDTASGISDICNFASKYRCSGFSTSCLVDGSQSVCVSSCLTLLGSLGRPCQQSLRSEIRTTLLPLAVMFYLSLLTVACDWLMLQRLVHYGRIIGSAMGIDFWGNRIDASR